MPHAHFSSRKTRSHSQRHLSLHRAAGLGLGLLTLLSLSAGHAALAGTVNWDGTAADWFSNPSHWSNGSTPGAGDDAVNMSTAAMTLGQSTTINSFFSNGAFTLQGGTFSGSQLNSASTLTVNNVFTDNGGQINNFTVNQGTGGSLVFSTSGGNSLSSDIINAAVDLSSSTAYVRLFNANTFNSQISLGASGGNGIHLYDGNANMIIGSKGVLTGFGGVVQDNGGATFTNNGTVNANSSGQALNLALSTFANTGTAEATNGGTLTLNSATTNNTGLLAATGGGVLNISGTLSSSAGNSINGVGGTVNIMGATLLGTINETPGTSLVFNTNGGNNLNGTTVNGNLDLSSSTAYVRLFNIDTVNGNISLGASGGNGIHLYDGNTNLVLGSGGSLTGFGGVVQDNGGATLTNNGTVNANVSGQTLNINTSSFMNAGTTAVQNGAALSVTSANTDSGNILVAKGGTATFTQGVAQTAGLTQVNGTLNSPLTLSGGTLTGSGTVNGDVANTGGTVAAGSPFGTLAVNGAFSQTSGMLDAVFSSTQSNLLLVSGAVTTGGTLSVSYLGSGAYTGFTPFTFLDYGSLGTEPTNALGLTQYFANETPLTNTTGTIIGQNGFTYELINNTGLNALQLQVLTNGAPVPEASTNLSLGALLTLGGLGLWRAKRRTVHASRDSTSQ